MVEFRLRLYRGQDDELIDWLEQFDERPYGAKTQAVKEALLRGMAAGGSTELAEVLGQGSAATPVMDLTEVRRVVEAAVATALSRFEGGVIGRPITTSEEDDETEDLLDALGETLVLGD